VCGIGTTHVAEPGEFHAMSVCVCVFLIKSEKKKKYVPFSKYLKLRHMLHPESAMSQTDAGNWHFLPQHSVTAASQFEAERFH
jgi:hypothetical protein